MTDPQKERLVAFVYLLTRGTPEFAGVPWGAVKGILRAHLASSATPVLTSPGGEVIAREIVAELLSVTETCSFTELTQELDTHTATDPFSFEGLEGAESFKAWNVHTGKLRAELKSVIELARK